MLRRSWEKLETKYRWGVAVNEKGERNGGKKEEGGGRWERGGRRVGGMEGRTTEEAAEQKKTLVGQPVASTPPQAERWGSSPNLSLNAG